MYERAKYFNIKFNRNGIYGLAICAFLIYFAFKKQEPVSSLLYVYAVMSLFWIATAFWINAQLKLKDASAVDEIIDERFPFRSVEQILSLLLVIFIILSNKKWEYENYFAVPLMLVYIGWTFSQMRMLNNYFKS